MAALVGARVVMASRRLFLKRTGCAVGLGWIGWEGLQEFGFGNATPGSLSRMGEGWGEGESCLK